MITFDEYRKKVDQLIANKRCQYELKKHNMKNYDLDTLIIEQETELNNIIAEKYKTKDK